MTTIAASAQETAKKPVKEKPKEEVAKFTPPKIVKNKEVKVETVTLKERKPEPPPPPPPPPKMKKPGNGKMAPPAPPPPKVKKAAKAALPKIEPAGKAE